MRSAQSKDVSLRTVVGVLVLGDERDTAAEAAARNSYKGKYKAKGKFMAMFVLLNPCFYCYGMCIYKYSLYDTVHFYKKKIYTHRWI